MRNDHAELQKEYSKALGWSEYPIGTRVYAFNGGSWERVAAGYKWCTGDTFPTPGADWLYIVRPSEY